MEEPLNALNISEGRVKHFRSGLLTGASEDEVEIGGVGMMMPSLCDLITVRVDGGGVVACV